MKTAAELNITEEQRTNLARLAVGVRKLRRGRRGYNGSFNMSTYCREGGDFLYLEQAEEALHKCGTAACLLGHGPFVGIKPKYHDTWRSYEKDSFGCDNLTPPWEWMFHFDWDNNKGASVKRIAWFLKYGIPSVFDASDNKYPKGFFRFKPDWAAIEKLAAGGAGELAANQ
jgi:hypothetical protein